MLQHCCCCFMSAFFEFLQKETIKNQKGRERLRNMTWKKCQFTSLTSIQQEIYQLLTNTLVHFFLTMVSHPLAKKFYPFLFKVMTFKNTVLVPMKVR